jgi:hypothetical protein
MNLRILIVMLSAAYTKAACAALVCIVQLLYEPSALSKTIKLDTRFGDDASLGKQIEVSLTTTGLLDDWSSCLLLATHGDSDPKRVEEGYRYGSLQLQCEGKNNVFVRSFLANFLPGDEGLVHGETRIVDGYSGKAIQIETSCTFHAG